MSWISLLVIGFLVCLLCVSVYYVIKFGIIIIKIQDAVEDALDVLDQRYASLDKIIKTPLFYDSPEVRSTLRDIKLTRDAVLNIARELTTLEIEDELGEDSFDDEGA